MDIEKVFIGSVILSQKKILEVVKILDPKDLKTQPAITAYLIILGLWEDRKAISLSSVAIREPSLAMYLSESTEIGDPLGVIDQATTIKETSRAGRIKDSLAKIMERGNSKEKLDNILNLYNKEIFIDSKNPSIRKVINRLEKSIIENKKTGNYGFSTGIETLDDNYTKYMPGHIWTIGGFTSTGKTAMMVQKICNLISLGQDPSLVIVSTEMTEYQLLSRIIANFTRVHPYRILSGKYRHGEEEEVQEIKKNLSNINLSIYDDIYDITDIEKVFRSADLQGGVDIGFIDYVQNCSVKESTSQYQEQSTLAKRIQKLAKDVNSTIICLSQVSNDVGRGNTTQLELKGAGEWAAVSDCGIMLERGKNNKSRLHYSVKKNRHGKLIDCLFEYKADFTRLEIIS